MFKDVTYIHKKDYKNHKEIIENSKHPTVFISFELGRDFERDVKAFATNYPDTFPIMVFRKHSGYLASQYKRYLKNGYTLTFDEFFNPQQKSLFSNEEVSYKNLLDTLEENFTNKPYVLMYNDFIKQPVEFCSKIATYIGAKADFPDPLPEAIHVSYTERQLKLLLSFFKSYISSGKLMYKNKFVRYGILYLAKFLPERKGELIPKSSLEAIDKYFEEDWNYCIEYQRS